MFKNILWATAIFGVTIGILMWAEYQTNERNEFWDRNDECMKKEVGMTTMQWQQLSGELKICHE